MDLFNSDLILSTNHLILEHVSITDAQNIYELRMQHNGSVLKKISNGVEQQKKYLKDYLCRFDNRTEIYYSIKSLDRKENYGYVRLTELNHDFKFSYESLILKENAPKNISLDVIISIYKLGFNVINREVCGPWAVPIEGERVIKLHSAMKMIDILSKNDKYFICIVLREKFLKNVKFFEKFGLGAIKIN